MKKLLLFSLPIILISCVTSRYINYSVNNIIVPKDAESIPINVDIRTLTDNRAMIEDNMVLFTDPRETTINKKRMCINSEKHYNQESVVNQITRILVKHINSAKLFSNATFNENIDSIYYLTGALYCFYGEQEFSLKAKDAVAIGAMFGLVGGMIGGAISDNIKTPGTIVIEISDLKLFRKDGTLVKDLGNFSQEYKGDFKENGSCWCIYETVNVKLKDFNTKLIEKLRVDLMNAKL